MHVGKLTRLGNSMAVVVTGPSLRHLGWFQGDQIEQRVENGRLVLKNITQQPVKAKRKRGEFDDASAHSRVEQSV
jgi:antitoxin component of MazEF toxin-antitoxin module